MSLYYFLWNESIHYINNSRIIPALFPIFKRKCTFNDVFGNEIYTMYEDVKTSVGACISIKNTAFENKTYLS